ncbi:helix-turn-helix domain-containing protein [Sphingobium sp.]|uniref:helix-turn-helix domain-containing protein n=1 Tax=Sphingobium sp. TaxID=1912891 RepID=UPI0035C771D1
MSTALQDYMDRKKVTDADLSAKIGRDRSIVSRIRRGKMLPSLEIAAAIERATGGKVPMKSWVQVPAEQDAA